MLLKICLEVLAIVRAKIKSEIQFATLTDIAKAIASISTIV